MKATVNIKPPINTSTNTVNFELLYGYLDVLMKIQVVKNQTGSYVNIVCGQKDGDGYYTVDGVTTTASLPQTDNNNTHLTLQVRTLTKVVTSWLVSIINYLAAGLS